MEEEIKKEIIGKAGFPLYVDYWDKYFSLMSGDQVKEVLEIIYHFNKTYQVNHSKDLSVVMVVNTIVDNLKRDAAKRLTQSRANRENGKKGGRPAEGKKPKKPKKPKKTPSKCEETQLAIPDFIGADLWNNFVKMRKESKKAMTETTMESCISKLTKFENEKEGNANQSLENSIAGGWQGLYEPTPDNNNSRIKF